MTNKIANIILFAIAWLLVLSGLILLATDAKRDFYLYHSYIIPLIIFICCIIPIFIIAKVNNLNLFYPLKNRTKFLQLISPLSLVLVLCIVSLFIGNIIKLSTALVSAYTSSNWKQIETNILKNGINNICSEFNKKVNKSYKLAKQIANENDIIKNLSDTNINRPILFQALNKIVKQKDSSNYGVEVFDNEGNSLAWSGWNTPTSNRFFRYASQDTLNKNKPIITVVVGRVYSVLKVIFPIESKVENKNFFVVVDYPIETNYQIDSRFLRSTSFAREMSNKLDMNVETTFFMDNNLFVSDSSMLIRYTQIMNELNKEKENGNNKTIIKKRISDGRAILYSYLISPISNEPLGILSITGKSRLIALNEINSTGATISLILLLLSYCFVPVVYFKSQNLKISKLPTANRQLPTANSTIIYFLFFTIYIWIGRSLITNFSFPSRIINVDLFNPIHYASTAYRGIFKSSGDLLITSLFIIGNAFLLIYFIRHLSLVPSHSSLFSCKFSTFIILTFALSLIFDLFYSAQFTVINSVIKDSDINLFDISDFLFSYTDFATKFGLFLSSIGCLLMNIGILFLIAKLSQKSKVRWIISIALLLTLYFGLFNTKGVQLYIHFLYLLAIVSISTFVSYIQQPIKALNQFRWSIGFVVLVVITTLFFLIGLSETIRENRQYVKNKIQEISQPRDTWAKFVLENVLHYFTYREGLAEKVRTLPKYYPGGDNIAFVEWAKSALSNTDIGCSLKIISKDGNEISKFSIGIPHEEIKIDPILILEDLSFTKNWVVYSMNKTMGGKRIDMFLGAAPLYSNNELVGAVLITLPYLYQNLHTLSRVKSYTPEIFGYPPLFTSNKEEPILYFNRYEDNILVESSIPTAEWGKRINPTIEKILSQQTDVKSKNILSVQEENFGNKIYELYYIIWEQDGKTDALAIGFEKINLSKKLSLWFSLLIINTAFFIVLYLLIRFFYIINPIIINTTNLNLFNNKKTILNFRDKLFIAFLLVSFPSILIFGFFSKNLTIEKIDKQIINETDKNLQTTINYIQEDIKASAERLANSTPVIDFATYIADEVMNKELSNYLSTNISQYDEVVIYDINNEKIWEWGEIAKRTNVDESILSLTSTTVFYQSSLGLTISSATPILSKQYPQEKIGTLILIRPFNKEWINKISNILGNDISVFDMDRLLASNRAELYQSELLNTKLNSTAYLNIGIWNRERFIHKEKVGNYPYIVGYNSIKDLKGNVLGALSVLSLYEQTEINKEIRKSTSIIITSLIFIFTLVLILAITLSGTISRPLAKLTEATKRIANGDLSFRIPSSNRDEIGELINSFNQMTNDLEKSREALKERTRYIETIVNNLDSSVIAVDNMHRITAVNYISEELLGLSFKDAIGKEIISHFKQCKDSILADTIDELCKSQDRGYKEITLSKEDKTITLAISSASLLDEKNQRLGTLFVFRDITDLIKTKKILAWGEMASQVAHEIKNPLTPIKLSIQHLHYAYQQQDPNFKNILDECCNTIIEQIERLRHTSIEFSQFARTQQEERTLEDINSVITDCVKLYSLGSKDIKFDTKLTDNLPQIKIGRDSIKRVFINLIENAIQAMPNGGKITIKTRIEMKDEGQGTSNSIIIEIEDTGVGIPEENLEKLFEPNFSTKTGGTGLGLAICKQIIDAHNGKINIESQQAIGTKVTISLPC